MFRLRPEDPGLEPVKIRAEVVQTFRSARHGRPEGLHYAREGFGGIDAVLRAITTV
jgi:hypothetical protein